MRQIKYYLKMKGSFVKQNNRFIFKDNQILCNRKGSVIEVKKNNVIINADVTGIDKIYYSLKNRQLVISNKFKDFLGNNINNDINNEFINFQIKKGYVPYPFTILKNVRKAPPGLITKISFDKNNELVSLYEPSEELKIFNINKKFNKNSFGIKLKKFLSLDLKNSDVIISSFSGGFDSLLLTYLLNKKCRYIIHFSDKQDLELSYYKNLWPDLKWIVTYDAENFTERDRQSYFEAIDEPACDAAGFAEYLMIKKLLKELKIKSFLIMNGQSADGLFCNGREYFQDFISSKINLLITYSKLNPSKKLRRIHTYTLNTKKRFFEDYAPDHDLSRATIREIEKIYLIYRASINNDSTNFLASLVFMLKYSLHGVEKIKTVSRAFNVRYFLPFMSLDVIRFAFSIPAKYKIGYNHGKRILIESYPELKKIKHRSHAFIPAVLKKAFIIKSIGKSYEEFFTNCWIKVNLSKSDE